MTRHPLLIALLVPIGAACVCGGPRGGDSPADTFAGTFDTSTAACVPSDSPTLELGLGDESWSPMGDTVMAEGGSQGGQHLWLAFRSTGFDLSGASVVWITGDVDGERYVDQTARLAWTCHDDGTAQVLGLQVPVPDDLLGHAVRFEATVTDPEQRAANAVATVVVDG